MGTQSAQECRKIAEVLKPYFNERNLFVISTDFAHYPTYNDAVTADKATCDAIVSRSPAALMKFLTDYEKKDIPNLSTNLCGWTSVLTLLYLLEGDPSMTIKPVQYMNSGDSDQGNRSQVVGYWSMVVTKEGKREKDETFAISDNEKMQLLMIARRTVEGYCRYRRIPESGFSGLSQGMTMRASCADASGGSLQKNHCMSWFSKCLSHPLPKIHVFRLCGRMNLRTLRLKYRFYPP
jgi:hypothetical protein